jgi:hypothetical protein
MGFNMSFVVTSDRPISLNSIEAALKHINPEYSIRDLEDSEAPGWGSLYIGPQEDDILGELELYTRLNREGELEEQIEIMTEFASEHRGPNRARVLRDLKTAPAVLDLRVLWMGREDEETLQRIDPLWNWLFKEYGGLLKPDYEPFQDANGAVHPLPESRLRSFLRRLRSGQ